MSNNKWNDKSSRTKVNNKSFHFPCRNNTLCYFALIIITASYIILLSLFTQFRNGTLMYKAWLPFDSSISAVFYFAYTNQIMSLAFIGLVHPTSDSLICGLLLHVCCQIEILEYRLSNIPHGRGSLRDCVRHHVRIYEYVVFQAFHIFR